MTGQEPLRALTEGTQLGNRYTLTRKLGAGASTETWLATDRSTGAAVALKVLAASAFPAAALRREWQLSLRLLHAHIVRVFEFHDEDPAFYSLQFIDGPDVGVLAGAPVDDVLPCMALVADALRYAHAKSVVHRDIKAANVLLDQNGSPYLIDFGVASSRGEDIGGGSLIAASPAQLAGEPPSPADDIFALGGLIYELVSGRSAYSGSATADDIANRVPPPLSAADGSAVPPDVADLVARMLDKDAELRPDAAEVATSLTASGYAGRPVPQRYVARQRVQSDEVIETATIARPARKVAAGTDKAHGIESAGSGIRPSVLGASLVVLLLLLLGVVFLLPKAVQEQAADLPAVSDGTTEPGEPDATSSAEAGDEPQQPGVSFNENREDLSGRDSRVQDRAATEQVLGELLSKMDTLQNRGVQRWGGLPFKRAQATYAEGDEAYLARDYATASARYREAIEIVDPLLDQVDTVFRRTLDEAQAALDAADAPEALRLFELAVAISPNSTVATSGYDRARNLDEVISLTDQGLEYEQELELQAAQASFERAIEIDPQWQPAQTALARVNQTLTRMTFDQRMTEGFTALADGDYLTARAAFRMAQEMKPGSPEPADGLLQVEQGLQLNRIAALEQQSLQQVAAEQWEEAVETYADLLELDANLVFALDGQRQAEQMVALHQQLDEYVGEPDSLSNQATMQRATRLVVDITRMSDIGPRLAAQRDELSRLLKRAATPLRIRIVSDNATEVSIYKVGRLGSFDTRELDLRPGTYVAVGSRPGYRDVRLEFRVAPEIEMQPVIVRCEERI